MTLPISVENSLMRMLSLSGINFLYRSFTQGHGAILRFQDMCARPKPDFCPNKEQIIHPHFFDKLLAYFKRHKIDILSLDEAIERMKSKAKNARYFVVLTFDYGYKSLIKDAFPILQKYDAPFSVFLATAYVDGHKAPWWRDLASIINQVNAVGYHDDKQSHYLSVRSLAEKKTAYEAMYKWILKHGPKGRSVKIAGLMKLYGLSRQDEDVVKMLAWEDVKKLAQSPLCTLGLHGIDGLRRENASRKALSEELASACTIFRQSIGGVPRYFAYPDAEDVLIEKEERDIIQEFGFIAAVSTRYGVLNKHSLLTPNDLPRINVSGLRQSPMIQRVIMSGRP